VRVCEPEALTYHSPSAVSLYKKRVAGCRLRDVIGRSPGRPAKSASKKGKGS
jgi:hypothetical protein